MTTLIAVYNLEGLQGRCDEKCYNAKHSECQCVCTGKNHGAGIDRAINNTRELAESWMEQYRQEHPDILRFERPAEVLQETLWSTS